MQRNVLDFLEASAARAPGRIALADVRGETTYGELLDAARRIGSALAGRVGRQEGVAVLMDARDRRCVAAFMGIAYAGCFYAPLDPAMPPERLRRVLGQLRPALILYDGPGQSAVEALEEKNETLSYEAAVSHAADPAALGSLRLRALETDVLSVLYTSGSTGMPKGVMQSQRGYVLHTAAIIRRYGFRAASIFGNQSPFFYANSVMDLYPALALGALNVILPAQAIVFPKRMVELLTAYRVSELVMTPSSYARVAQAGVLLPGCLPRLRCLIFSGEPASWSSLRAWGEAAPNARLWHIYGSTETYSVAANSIDRAYSEGERLPVGPLFPEVKISIQNGMGEEAQEGELLVSNPWLASGYYREEGLTRAAFPVIGGKRYFQTGDFVRMDAAGSLTVLGRRDSQIKHHGYRMDLGELEAALRSLPGWQGGCCLAEEETGEICCFWTGPLTQGELQKGLRGLLPRYALPDRYMYLARLPYTPNGKLDRRHLRGLAREKKR